MTQRNSEMEQSDTDPVAKKIGKLRFGAELRSLIARSKLNRKSELKQKLVDVQFDSKLGVYDESGQANVITLAKKLETNLVTTKGGSQYLVPTKQAGRKEN